MEERLDDAINVLRNHAESVGGGPQPGGSGNVAVTSVSHSNGLMTAYPPVLEPLMVFTSSGRILTFRHYGQRHLPP